MKKSFVRNGIKFKVKYDGNSIIEVVGYEKILGIWWPTAEDGFWICDFETIEAGVEKAVKRILRKYGLDEENQKKLKEYFN